MCGAVHPASRSFVGSPERRVGEDEMEDGMSKAIPLRRSRNGTRAVANRTESRWTDAVTNGIRRVAEPPRQLWLAGLGTTALAVRGVLQAWDWAVEEGVSAEGWLRQRLGRNGTPPA